MFSILATHVAGTDSYAPIDPVPDHNLVVVIWNSSTRIHEDPNVARVHAKYELWRGQSMLRLRHMLTI